MSSNQYTKVDNTLVSGSSLMSSLLPDDVRALQFSAAVNNMAPAVMVAGTAYALTSQQLMQALTSSLLVNTQAVTATAPTLTLGADTADNAAAFIQLFNLDDATALGAVAKRVLSFEMDFANSPAQAVALANTSSPATTVYVQIKSGGGSSAATQTLFASAAAGGRIQRVEVYATSLTAGAEVVVFNRVASNA